MRGLQFKCGKKAILSINGPYREAYMAGKLDIIAIGKKGADILKSKNIKIAATHHQLFDKLKFDNTAAVITPVLEDFIKGKYGLVKLIL